MSGELSVLQERWIWLAGSVGLALLVTWIRYGVQRLGTQPQPWLDRWRVWPGRPWFLQIVRLLYAIGLPAAALFWRGVLTERGLGFQPLQVGAGVPQESAQAGLQDWAGDVGWALVAVVLVVAIFVLTRRRLTQLTGRAYPRRRSWGLAIREACYHQVHWAFYREPFVLLWGAGSGAWGGMLLVLVEAGLNPARWADLRTRGRGDDLLLRGMLAVISAVLFVQTQNLWVLLLVDIVLGWGLGFSTATESIVE